MSSPSNREGTPGVLKPWTRLTWRSRAFGAFCDFFLKVFFSNEFFSVPKTTTTIFLTQLSSQTSSSLSLSLLLSYSLTNLS